MMTEIGWREWVSLPDLDVPGIKAKIDTGARTSVLHTAEYECFEDEEEQPWVRFTLHPLKKRKDCLRQGQARVKAFREVKDSGGHIEKRPFIETRVRLGDLEWLIELSLTNREQMRFRMLIGRRGLESRFLVNPAKSYLVGKNLSARYRVGEK